MKTCQVISSWPLDSTIGSGTANVVRATKKILSNNQFKVRVISADYPAGGYIFTSLRRIKFNLGLNKLADADEPTIAFDFDGFWFSKKRRWVSVNQGVLADVARFEAVPVRQTVRMLAALEQVAVRKAERVFTPSRYSADKISELYGVSPGKIEVAPNGVFKNDVPEFSPRIKNRPPVVLCVARLYRRKGVDLLLRAWKLVHADEPEAVLQIAGDGLEYKNLKNLARELELEKNVTFLGDVPDREKMAALYAGADVFCLPTLHETFGIVFLEAMSAGLPIVALNATAVPEVVRHETDGLLTGPSEKDAAGALISLIKDGALREKMGRAGRERVLRDFLWEKTSAGFVEYISRW